MYVTKETLKELNLQIEECKNCGHPTLQHKKSPAKWQCLSCGLIWHLEYVEGK